MICPSCASDIGFLHFKKHFRCSFCNQKLVLKQKNIYIDLLIASILLPIFPIPENKVFSWLFPFFYMFMVYIVVFIMTSYIEVSDEHDKMR